MSIIKIEKTQEDIAKDIAKKVLGTNLNGLNKLKDAIRSSFSLIWDNPNATPQEILDEFGTNAKELFIASAKTIAFIKSFDEEYEEPKRLYEFTINEDGTVVVGDKIEDDENNE